MILPLSKANMANQVMQDLFCENPGNDLVPWYATRGWQRYDFSWNELKEGFEIRSFWTQGGAKLLEQEEDEVKAEGMSFLSF